MDMEATATDMATDMVTEILGTAIMKMNNHFVFTILIPYKKDD